MIPEDVILRRTPLSLDLSEAGAFRLGFHAGAKWRENNPAGDYFFIVEYMTNIGLATKEFQDEETARMFASFVTKPIIWRKEMVE